jgi:membrane protein implicated in regulation of membrane protease activity
MTTDQVVIGAIAAVILILVVAGIVRAATRRGGRNEDEFGAGGRPEVAVGTRGVAKTVLAPSGVVLAAGEQWTARSARGVRIEPDQPIRVVGQDGLTLIVESESAARPAGE